MLSPAERVTKKEMERRHALVRLKMKEQGIEILLVSGVRFVGSIGYLRYLSNWAEPFAGETLLFPTEGTPLFFARTSERAILVKNLLGGMEAVTGSTAGIVAEYVKKTGKKKIGICGLRTMFADYYVQLCKALPTVEFKDYSALMDEVRMVKSPEELLWVNQSAKLGDIAFNLFSSLVQEGREEGEIFLEVEHLVKRLGAENTYFMMATDPNPVAKFIDLAFDKYKKGDLIFFNAEIAGPGGYYTQLVRTLSMGKANAEAIKAADVCLRTLDAVEQMMKPGVITTDIYKVIVDSIQSSGFRMGLHPGHSQGLDIFERPLINESDCVTLKKNMVIVIHPHVLLSKGGGIWMGDMFVITDKGCRRLHETKQELLVLS
jgi:Xaa-Pro aminopeptidase